MPILTTPRTLCGVQKLVCCYVYLLEVLVPHHFMISWWMVFCQNNIPQCFIPSFPIEIEVDHLILSILEPMSISCPRELERFNFMKELTISNTIFAVQIEGIAYFLVTGGT